MIQSINIKTFEQYGYVIEHPGKEDENKEKSLFHIVCTEADSVGWRIAYLILRDQSADTMEQHPGSLESFEPVSGDVLLYVANKPIADKIDCFYLDRPVILHRGIWHAVVSISKESEIKITENAKVGYRFWQLGFSLDASGEIYVPEDIASEVEKAHHKAAKPSQP